MPLWHHLLVMMISTLNEDVDDDQKMGSVDCCYAHLNFTCV